MSKKAQELAARYGRKSDVLEIAREIIEEKRRNGELEDIALEEYRASPYPVKINTENGFYYSYKKHPVITADNYIQVMEWGLIPFWTKTAKQADQFRKMTINARVETLFEKPMFKSSVKYRRCLIPSTGYYEFHYENAKAKAQPYYIFLKTIEIFSIAGIYDSWTDPDTGNVLFTYSMITTRANSKTSIIHNGGQNPFRMPLILAPEQEDLWLDDNLSEKEIKEFFFSPPDDNMDAFPVNKNIFFTADSHNPEIMEPDTGIVNVLDEKTLF